MEATAALDEVVLVDGQGNPTGTMRRTEIHGPDTPRHRAFSVYLVDPAGRVLITRRSLKKTTWPGVWTNSCCGHPRPGERDAEAIERRVRDELGITIDHLEPMLPDFAYEAVDASGVRENEICPVYRAQVCDPTALRLDPDEVIEHAWVPWDALVATATATPAVLSPWSTAQIRQLASARLSPLRGTPKARIATSARSLVPSLADTLAAVQHRLNDSLAGLETLWHSLGADPDPLLRLDLPAWLQDFVQAGGKRLRPTLCHWGFVAAGGTATHPGFRVMAAAGAALELLHAFALIHDDVMDESDLRRGQPAAHRQAAMWHATFGGRGSDAVFGRNLAILLGDLTLVQAHRVTEQWSPVLRDKWHELCVELVLGQRGDLTGAAAGCRDRVRVERVSQLKSGAYSVTRPLELGALAAGANASVCHVLADYGFHTGAAFALRDDILGIWGEPSVTGKPAGDDLVAAKPTVVLSMATERLSGAAANALHRIGTAEARADDVALLQAAMTETGVRAEAEQMISHHVAQAIAALDGAALVPEGADGLREVTRIVAWRSS
jgi:geranylgeranyl diphosphate synthase type I